MDYVRQKGPDGEMDKILSKTLITGAPFTNMVYL